MTAKKTTTTADKTKKIDLVAELGIGADDATPVEITLNGADLKLRTHYTGAEVVAFQAAFSQTEFKDYFVNVVRTMADDTDERVDEFVKNLHELSVAAAVRVVGNMAIHAGLIKEDGGLALGSAQR